MHATDTTPTRIAICMWTVKLPLLPIYVNSQYIINAFMNAINYECLLITATVHYSNCYHIRHTATICIIYATQPTLNNAQSFGSRKLWWIWWFMTNLKKFVFLTDWLYKVANPPVLILSKCSWTAIHQSFLLSTFVLYSVFNSGEWWLTRSITCVHCMGI